jgi:O-succinylbenzoate synthase
MWLINHQIPEKKMKINQINLRHLRMTLRTPFETSFGRSETRDCILIEACAGDLVGYGECVADADPGYSYETIQTAWHIIRDFLAPVMLRQDIESPQELQERFSFVRGHPMAKAGLEMALWDLLGKRDGRSLREIFGGSQERVAVGVSVGLQASPEALVEVVGGSLEQGQALHHLDDLNLLLIEQPLAEDDLWDHSQLQKRLRTPICLDESILSVRHARQALEMNACRVINIKAGRVGGLSEGLAIHDLCYGRGVPVWCGGMLETGVGRASNLALASLPGFTLPGDISASDRYYLEDITQERFTLNPDSTISVPGGPGLGVSLDAAALERATMARLSLP